MSAFMFANDCTKGETLSCDYRFHTINTMHPYPHMVNKNAVQIKAMKISKIIISMEVRTEMYSLGGHFLVACRQNSHNSNAQNPDLRTTLCKGLCNGHGEGVGMGQ